MSIHSDLLRPLIASGYYEFFSTSRNDKDFITIGYNQRVLDSCEIIDGNISVVRLFEVLAELNKRDAENCANGEYE